MVFDVAIWVFICEERGYLDELLGFSFFWEERGTSDTALNLGITPGSAQGTDRMGSRTELRLAMCQANVLPAILVPAPVLLFLPGLQGTVAICPCTALSPTLAEINVR